MDTPRETLRLSAGITRVPQTSEITETDFPYDLTYTTLILSVLMVMVGGILLAYLIRYVL